MIQDVSTVLNRNMRAVKWFQISLCLIKTFQCVLEVWDPRRRSGALCSADDAGTGKWLSFSGCANFSDTLKSVLSVSYICEKAFIMHLVAIALIHLLGWTEWRCIGALVLMKLTHRWYQRTEGVHLSEGTCVIQPGSWGRGRVFHSSLASAVLSCLILIFCHFRLIKSLKETWMTKIPVLMFLSNFTVTEGMWFPNLLDWKSNLAFHPSILIK